MALLDLEGQILARLDAALATAGRADVAVRPMREIPSIKTAPVPTPALLVSYAGAQPGVPGGPGGKAVKITQFWLVTALVRNVANASDADATAEAGALAEVALSALMGWQGAGADGPLALSDMPPPGFASGYYWLPLQFQALMVRSAS